MIIGAGYFHLKSLIAKNKKEFLTTYEKSRDTTRPGNKSFGLNYGYKTDSAIEEMLDTGDILFMQSNCAKSFSMSELAFCYKKKATKNILGSLGINKSDWDSVGVIIRDKTGPRVLFFSCQEVYDLEYGETLTLPFFQDIAVRKMRTAQKDIGYVGSEFRAQVINENLESGISIADPAELPLKYWRAAKLLEGEGADGISVEKIDCAKPQRLNLELAAYSEPIIVRTGLSRLDEKNY